MSGQRSRASRGGAADGGSPTVVRTDGVRVAKTLSDDAAAIPVIRYEIESTTDTAIAVSLRDTMPSGIEADDVGFHADYEADRWQKTGDGVEFRCPLGPNDHVETVVGLRTASEPDPGAFATEPELTVLGSDGSGTGRRNPSTDDGGSSGPEEPTLTAGEEPADWERGMDLSSIEEAFGGQDATDSPESAAADAADEDDEPPTLDLEDPVGESGDTRPATVAEEPPTGGSDDGHASATTEGALDAGDDVVGALVDAFRNDHLDEADRELLRNELNLELADSTSSFVEHLQSRAKRKRDQLTEELDGLEDSITDLYGLKADASTVSNVEERLETLQDTAAEAERVQALAASLRDLDDRAASETALDDVVARLDDLADDAARADGLERVAEAARELEARKAEERDVAALERSLASDIRTVRSDLASEIDASRTELDDRVDEVVETHATVSELHELEGRVETLGERVSELEGCAAAAEDLQDAETRLDTAISTLAEEVEALDERAAADADLTTVEDSLRADYVTEADVESVVETRLDQGVERFLALALGSGALVSSLTVGATTSLTAGGAVATVGILLLGVWWYLGRQRTDPGSVGV